MEGDLTKTTTNGGGGNQKFALDQDSDLSILDLFQDLVELDQYSVQEDIPNARLISSSDSDTDSRGGENNTLARLQQKYPASTMREMMSQTKLLCAKVETVLNRMEGADLDQEESHDVQTAAAHAASVNAENHSRSDSPEAQRQAPISSSNLRLQEHRNDQDVRAVISHSHDSRHLQDPMTQAIDAVSRPRERTWVYDNSSDNNNENDHDQGGAYMKEILAPYNYLQKMASNNKNMRSKFINAFNEVYCRITRQEVLESINDVVSQLHNASLLIDDIEDDSKFRRGEPAAHTEFGIPLTINCGNYIYFEALSTLHQLWRTCSGDYAVLDRVIRTFIFEMKDLHKGQGQDIFWRDELCQLSQLPTLSDYFQMAKNKTGGLFRLSVKLLALFSPNWSQLDVPRLEQIANCLGILYQVRDDYLNLVDSRYCHMKGIKGEDLIEGKISLPILICLREELARLEQHQLPKSASALVDLLYNHSSQDERLRRRDLHSKALKLLTSDRITDETFNVLVILQRKIHELAASAPLNSRPLTDLVDKLCEHCFNCRH
ncbi:uncharacterized protein LODBEIA_P55590 [Lodderomyces beijingensis]|uniref:Geranylgeranyl pyrophosphate synthase n=1 Tax=Lodderomyces beijingensis TaxID=1775926 RepID=A0ABP0ZT71_9ASCO